jgi:aminocarboxymuconate-semialdehyde decarboxylase
MATAPLQDGRLAAEELRYAVRLGMRAVQIGSHVAGRNLDDPDHDPFWRVCQDEGLFILIHPVQPLGAPRFDRYGFVYLVGNPTEVGLAGACLILGGVLERFPALTVCLVHGGGPLPYQFGRLDHGFATRADTQETATIPPREQLKRLYFDTLTYSEPALRYLIDLVGPEHVLFGTDTPFPIAERDPLRLIQSRIAGLPAGDQALILGGNAERLIRQ